MRRTNVMAPLIAIVAGALIFLGYTVASGNSPTLGLDLQGGASVVLAPKHKVTSGVLDKSIDIIRTRVDALGVAEPQITRQGSNIVIELPGVKDKNRALQVVGQTAQLLFRPVLQAGVPDTQQTTPRDQDTKDNPNPVVLPETDRSGHVVNRYALGPAELDGTVVDTARAVIEPNTGRWQVDLTFTGKGSGEWDKMAGRYVGKQIAIDLDANVKSAPTIQTAQFNGRATISGDFTERQAKDLALVLRYGALPVQLEQQTVQTVSATLGKDSLSAGIIAGVVGLVLVALYMVLYYRALGFIVWIGLAISGALLYSIITALNVVLSLSGAVGIIVSVGVTVDSYVVYFERLKDELRAGKTLRSSVDRGFSRAYRTILAADLVSLIGAFLLYILTVGSVRGFALFLGLSTALDLFTAYFFTRPMVLLLGRNRLFTEARLLGVGRGLTPAPAGSPAGGA